MSNLAIHTDPDMNVNQPVQSFEVRTRFVANQ